MTSKTIKNIVEKHVNFDISKDTRKHKYVLARWIYYKLCIIYTKENYQQFTNTVGRNRAIVYNALKKYDQEINNNKSFLKLHNTINRYIANSLNIDFKDMETLESIKNTYIYILQQKDNEIERLNNSLKDKIKSNSILQKMMKDISKLPEQKQKDFYENRVKTYIRLNSYETA